MYVVSSPDCIVRLVHCRQPSYHIVDSYPSTLYILSMPHTFITHAVSIRTVELLHCTYVHDSIVHIVPFVVRFINGGCQEPIPASVQMLEDVVHDEIVQVVCVVMTMCCGDYVLW